MSAALIWPDTIGVSRFSMRMQPNNRASRSPYSGSTQVIDLIGERWVAAMTLAVNSFAAAQRVEAFFAQLRGMDGTVQLWHIARPTPSGTMRGAPTVALAVDQGDQSVRIQAEAGDSLFAGDLIGIGGQLMMVAANVTAPGTGLMTVTLANRFRQAVIVGTGVVWNRPTAKFRQSTDMAAGPVNYGKAIADTLQVEFTESYP